MPLQLHIDCVSVIWMSSSTWQRGIPRLAAVHTVMGSSKSARVSRWQQCELTLKRWSLSASVPWRFLWVSSHSSLTATTLVPSQMYFSMWLPAVPVQVRQRAKALLWTKAAP